MLRGKVRQKINVLPELRCMDESKGGRQVKVYISGGITGIDPQECGEHFQKAEDFIRRNGWSPVNHQKMQAHLPEEDTTHEEYMVVSLAELSICNGIYMLSGWEKSKGAKQEREAALRMNKFVLYEDNCLVEGGNNERV